tara:strand:- start:672 stop:1043 length:372 start_codon:yes stop_codon:yes gene_type:complete
MNPDMSLKSPFELANECKGVLPTELINMILFNCGGLVSPTARLIKSYFEGRGGLVSPTARLIKNHMKENYMIEYTQLEYFIKYENVSPDDCGESLLDWEFITMELNPEEEKFFNLWEEEVYSI